MRTSPRACASLVGTQLIVIVAVVTRLLAGGIWAAFLVDWSGCVAPAMASWPSCEGCGEGDDMVLQAASSRAAATVVAPALRRVDREGRLNMEKLLAGNASVACGVLPMLPCRPCLSTAVCQHTAGTLAGTNESMTRFRGLRGDAHVHDTLGASRLTESACRIADRSSVRSRLPCGPATSCGGAGEELSYPSACYGLIRPSAPLGVQDRAAGLQNPQGLQVAASTVMHAGKGRRGVPLESWPV